MTYLAELFSQVVTSLLRNKLRSFLTMAGIAWGVASIVLIVAMGDGFKQGQRNNTKQLGENIVILFGGRTEGQAGGQRAGRRVRLTYDDVRIPIEQGRFINDADEKEARRICVMGQSVRKQLFADHSGVVGSHIAINGMQFLVAGLMANKNQNSDYNGLDEDKLYIPYTTMLRDIPPKDPSYFPGVLNNLVYQPASLDQWKAARAQVLRVLGRNHRFQPDDKGAVFIWDTVENAELVDKIFQSMTMFLGAIALVTLTLGGVGVMNIMLVSVNERTREIGLRKAIGATRRRILADFLVEGAVLALASGALGWLAAWSLATLVNSFPMPEMFAGLPVRGQTTAWAFSALGVIAIASALIPAWRAASLTPVEALRYER